jgi:hypothetical protein
MIKRGIFLSHYSSCEITTNYLVLLDLVNQINLDKEYE